MALFKNLLIKYDIYKYEGDYLILHCSREDFVKAPFNGEITKKGNDLILRTKEFKLYLSHITALKEGKVKAGDIIGQPTVGSLGGRKVAYIMVKLYMGNELQDIIKYLNFRDNVDIIEKVAEVKETTAKVEEVVEDEVKPKTTKKKSTKKSTKKK